MSYMDDARPQDSDGVNLYRGDWVIVERPLLKVEGEVVRVFEKVDKVKVHAGRGKYVTTNSSNCRLHEQGRPALRNEAFGRFD
jgi:hypothetical protein